MLDKTIAAELRKDAIDPGIDHQIVANLKVVTGLTHNAIAFVTGDFKILDQNIISRVENRIVEVAKSIQRCALTPPE